MYGIHNGTIPAGTASNISRSAPNNVLEGPLDGAVRYIANTVANTPRHHTRDSRAGPGGAE